MPPGGTEHGYKARFPEGYCRTDRCGDGMLSARIVRTGDGSLVNEIIEEGFTALKEDEAK